MPYPVDGYCKETDTVYEFQGCFMHGCPKCFNSNSFNPLKKQTMGYLYKTCSCSRKTFALEIFLFGGIC